MPSWKWREVRQALTAKGFQLDRSTDHEYYRLYYNGKATSVRTKISHGKKGELNSNSPLMNAIQHQLHLSRQKLEDLLNCPLTEAEYIRLLESDGHIRS